MISFKIPHRDNIQKYNRDSNTKSLIAHSFEYRISRLDNPAVVAWFAKASIFHSVNSAPSASSGSNPAWVIITVANAPAVYIRWTVI